MSVYTSATKIQDFHFPNKSKNYKITKFYLSLRNFPVFYWDDYMAKIEKSDNTKCWWGFRTSCTLPHTANGDVRHSLMSCSLPTINLCNVPHLQISWPQSPLLRVMPTVIFQGFLTYFLYCPSKHTQIVNLWLSEANQILQRTNHWTQ